MTMLVQLIGILILFLAAIAFIRPDLAKSAMGFWAKGKRFYFTCLIRFIIAVIFLMAAKHCHLTRTILILAILFLASALFPFLLSLERIKSWLQKLQNGSNFTIRLIATAVMTVAAVILYAA